LGLKIGKFQINSGSMGVGVTIFTDFHTELPIYNVNTSIASPCIF